MKTLILLLLSLSFVALVILSGCPSPDAKAKVHFKITQDTLFGDVTPDAWRHPIDSLFPVVFKWGPEDSVLTTYGELYGGFSLTLVEGNYQFNIYPLNPPETSKSLLWRFNTVQMIQESSYVIPVYPATDYYLILMDTTNTTWDGESEQGYYYNYYHHILHPAFSIDFTCGGEVKFISIEDPKPGKVYPVLCFLSYNIELFINHRFTMSMADTSFLVYR